MSPFFHHNLYAWFQTNKRLLPWRKSKTPYSVWVAEIMLQQTKASVVVPYFMRWMEAFPSVKSLAEADKQEVIKFWEGLGYYQRARNLHKGAKVIVDQFAGVFPKTKKELLAIPGIGPYTANAIMAFAYGSRCIAIDANVQRVLSRFFLIEEEIVSVKAQKLLENYASKIEKQSLVSLGEAFIELGALVCGKKPSCFVCPLKQGCQAFAKNMQESLPRKKKKIVYEKLERAVFLVEYANCFLIKKNQEGVMQDLWEFPYVSWSEDFSMEDTLKSLGLESAYVRKHTSVQHSFTRFRVILHSFHVSLNKKPLFEEYQLVEKSRLKTLAFSSGHRKILARMDW